MKVLSVISAALVTCASLVAGKSEDKAKKGDDPFEILKSATCKDLRESILDDVKGLLAFEDEDIIDNVCSEVGRYKLGVRLDAVQNNRAIIPIPTGENSYNNICQAALSELVQDSVAALQAAAEDGEEECDGTVRGALMYRGPIIGGNEPPESVALQVVGTFNLWFGLYHTVPIYEGYA